MRPYILAIRKFMIAVAWLCAAGCVASQSLANFYQGAPKPLSASEVVPALIQLKQGVAAGLPPPFEVEGVRLFAVKSTGSGLLPLAAEEIVLHPGSTLTMSAGNSGTGQTDRSIYIVARRLRVLPGDRPATITWQRPDAIATYPPPVGKASPGRAGTSSGEPGSMGAAGAAGNAGFAGQGAPTVYLAVQEIVGGTVFFDLRGQDGGPGGQGQDGGDGGPGLNGAPGSPSLFDCKRGGGNGGRGGKGGDGGVGGVGGKGGDGGTLVLMSSGEALRAIQGSVKVQVSGGSGGPGGRGGIKGSGGPGGQGGSGAGLCGGGSAGGPGGRGEDGGNGGGGEQGQFGAVIAVPLSTANVEAVGLK